MTARHKTNSESVCTLKEQFLSKFLARHNSIFQEFLLAAGSAYAYLDEDRARLAKISLMQSSSDLIEPEFNGIQVDVSERGINLYSEQLLFDEMHPLRIFGEDPKGAGAMPIWARVQVVSGRPEICLTCMDESGDGLPELPVTDPEAWNHPVFALLDFWQKACR